MTEKMLEVMWEINHPAFQYGLAELFVFPLNGSADLERHIAEMTGENGVYHENSARVIGVKESDHVFIPTYLIELVKRYDSTGILADVVGNSKPGFGHIQIHQDDMAQRIVQNEGYQSLDDYLA